MHFLLTLGDVGGVGSLVSMAVGAGDDGVGVQVLPPGDKCCGSSSSCLDGDSTTSISLKTDPGFSPLDVDVVLPPETLASDCCPIVSLLPVWVNGLSLSINCGFGPETGRFRFFSSIFRSLTFMSSSFVKILRADTGETMDPAVTVGTPAPVPEKLPPWFSTCESDWGGLDGGLDWGVAGWMTGVGHLGDCVTRKVVPAGPPAAFVMLEIVFWRVVMFSTVGFCAAGRIIWGYLCCNSTCHCKNNCCCCRSNS